MMYESPSADVFLKMFSPQKEALLPAKNWNSPPEVLILASEPRQTGVSWLLPPCNGM